MKYPRRRFAALAHKESVSAVGRHPEWWYTVQKPFLIYGATPDQIGVFCHAWRISERNRQSVENISGLYGTRWDNRVLFLLPYEFNGGITPFQITLRDAFNERDGVAIQVPIDVLRGQPWPDDLSLEISTRLAISKR